MKNMKLKTKMIIGFVVPIDIYQCGIWDYGHGGGCSSRE